MHIIKGGCSNQPELQVKVLVEYLPSKQTLMGGGGGGGELHF